MTFPAQIITWINVVTNSLGKILLAPAAILPGWLSNTIISAVTGVVLLIIFKYTSNQRAIGQVRDSIKANMLALKLFKDSLAVTLSSQAQLFKGALLLLIYALPPLLVMIVPVTLLLSQMALWYQVRPLLPSEQTLVVMQLDSSAAQNLPNVRLEPSPAAEVTLGPVHVPAKHQIYWQITAVKEGRHLLNFQVNGQQVQKELAVGNGFMRVSVQRPGQQWFDILMHPAEKPFAADSPVRSITINYPDRHSRTSGTDWWVIYFFIASMLFAFIFKPFLKVKI
jgi:uncharacterized membrane protein (DUF106 family)